MFAVLSNVKKLLMRYSKAQKTILPIFIVCRGFCWYFLLLYTSSFPHFSMYPLTYHIYQAHNKVSTVEEQCFAVLMWFANCSIYIWPQHVNKALFQLVKVFYSAPAHLSTAVLHPSSLYPGSTFALCLLPFVLQDVLIISSKNTILGYSTEQKI